MNNCPLSPKQLEVVQFLADGKTQTEIAMITNRARNTITGYVLDCHVAAGTYTMHGLVGMALRNGWVQ
jgi:DNA-binding NarL/FixJ family response regulator